MRLIEIVRTPEHINTCKVKYLIAGSTVGDMFNNEAIKLIRQKDFDWYEVAVPEEEVKNMFRKVNGVK